MDPTTLLFSVITALFVYPIAESVPEIPVVTFADLKSALSQSGSVGLLDTLRDRGGHYGSFAITDLPDGYQFSEKVRSLRKSGPSCIGKNQSLPEVELSDGSRRRTFATVNSEQIPKCLHDDLSSLSLAFDAAEGLVSDLIEAVRGQNLSYLSSSADETNGLGIPLREAPHKDHVHVYTKVHSNQSIPHDKEDEDFLVPYHLDNGLFLLITTFPDHGLEVTLSDKSRVSTSSLPSDSILVMFGLGLTDWLLQGQDDHKFWPVPHAVPTMTHSSLVHRTVYARMKVAPSESVPESSRLPKNQRQTFHQVFMKTYRDSESQTCSVDLKNPFKMLARKKDTWRDAMDKNCQEGDAFCWMGCYPLPEECPSVQNAMCFSRVTNVTCSTEPEGKPMDPTCKWECLPSDSQKFQTSDYCNGKMDMLMFGFETSGKKENPCIILFIEPWTLDSRVKFATACVGVMVLGFAIEGLIALRRLITRKKRAFINISTPARKGLTLFCFGLNLFLGYLAMLVAMTYSVELFLFVVLGLIVGHAVFNLNTAVGETIDPCCAASQNDVTKRKNIMGPIGTDHEATSILINKCEYEDEEDSPAHSGRGILLQNGSSFNGSCCSGGGSSSGKTAVESELGYVTKTQRDKEEGQQHKETKVAVEDGMTASSTQQTLLDEMKV